MYRLFPLAFLFSILLYSCKGDDSEDLSQCATPEDPTELPSCFLDEFDAIRPMDMDSITFKVNLYLRDGEPFYALLSSDIRALISVYNACCELDCQQGFPPPNDLCDWFGNAEDLGIIYEE